jgi:rhodanese-related sulfurtransferase
MKTLIILSAFVVAVLITTNYAALANEIPRISKQEAREMLDDPEVVFMDVRSGSDWRASQVKISGAVYEDYRNVETWVQEYDPEKTYILYCA